MLQSMGSQRVRHDLVTEQQCVVQQKLTNSHTPLEPSRTHMASMEDVAKPFSSPQGQRRPGGAGLEGYLSPQAWIVITAAP